METGTKLGSTGGGEGHSGAPVRPGRVDARSHRAWWLAVGMLVVAGAAVIAYLMFRSDLADRIVIPYIAHMKPSIDPHLPSSVAVGDKLDEAVFDGLFNLTAGPSGVVYEDGLGSFVGIDAANVVTVRLASGKRWHDAYATPDDDAPIAKTSEHAFSAADLRFTLDRIDRLGSLSPDYILVSQALDPVGFEGPNEANEVRFRFKGDRIWKEADIKEVLSFKIIPEGSDVVGPNLVDGTGPYMAVPEDGGELRFRATPDGGARIGKLTLKPFVDNSTYTTEFRAGTINLLLDTPFGSLSPVLEVPENGFVKSNISTTFFALLCNTERLTREQRRQLRSLIDPRVVLERFYKAGTAQRREIIDYKGNRNNYGDYLNSSVFPSSSYYIEEKVVEPAVEPAEVDRSLLPDTVRIKACMNSGFREEYAELIDILNDPAVTHGRVRVTAVPNEDLRSGDYDAVLVAFTGYRSNFLFDLYDVFLREPDLDVYRISLETEQGPDGTPTISDRSFQRDRNFFRLDAGNAAEREDTRTFLRDIYGFMSTRQIGDKMEYARRVDALEHEMALGVWLFSLPSLAYFGRQFDESSIDFYGVASQLSTIERWREKVLR